LIATERTKKNWCGRRAAIRRKEIIRSLKTKREGVFPKHLVPQLGELGFFWREPAWDTLRGNVQRPRMD